MMPNVEFFCLLINGIIRDSVTIFRSALGLTSAADF